MFKFSTATEFSTAHDTATSSIRVVLTDYMTGIMSKFSTATDFSTAHDTATSIIRVVLTEYMAGNMW